MKITIIGGTGHIGTYLVPRLVWAGHDVVVVSRSQRQPYQQNAAWDSVQMVTIDRAEAEKTHDFGPMIAGIGADVVVDLIGYHLDSTQQLVEALRGKVQHFIHCGTIWIYGHSVEVPASETQPRRPFGDYGIRKATIEAYLLDEARRNGFPATCLHPGHIVGPGWPAINPQGNASLWVWEALAKGETLTLPNVGMETLHHVHADDVAQIFQKAIEHWQAAIGESFHAVSPAAVTLRGFAEVAAGWFGQAAKLHFMPFDEWKTTVSEQEAQATYDHIVRSPNVSIDKARRLLDYAPRYSSLQGVREAVDWLAANGKIQV